MHHRRLSVWRPWPWRPWPRRHVPAAPCRVRVPRRVRHWGARGGLFALLGLCTASLAGETLDPAGIDWQTNQHDPVFASERARPGGVFRLAVAGGLDAPVGEAILSRDLDWVLQSLYRALSLVTRHPNSGAAMPMLATHWAETEPGREVYFRLDRQARWSDGAPLTSADFVFAHAMRRDGWPLVASAAEAVPEIADVEAVDAHTLVIRARSPVDAAVIQLGRLAPMPAHRNPLGVSPSPKNHAGEYPPTLGAYQVVELTEQALTLTRRRPWWGDERRYLRNRFNADRVVLHAVASPEDERVRFRAGDLDARLVTAPAAWRASADDPGVRNGSVHRIWFYNDRPRPAFGLWLNTSVPPLEDRRVRVALAHALDLETVLAEDLGGAYRRLESYTAGFGAYDHPDLRARRHDPRRAARALEEAGWRAARPGRVRKKGGRVLQLTLLYGDERQTARLEHLRASAREVGIRLVLARRDPADAARIMAAKSHQLALYAAPSGEFPWPQYRAHWHSTFAPPQAGPNLTATADDALDALLASYGGSTTRSERVRLAWAIQARIHELASFIPLYNAPFVRELHWSYWRAPEVPGTRASPRVFDPLHPRYGGLFWYDRERATFLVDLERQRPPAAAPWTRLWAVLRPSFGAELRARRSVIRLPPLTVIDRGFARERAAEAGSEAFDTD